MNLKAAPLVYPEAVLKLRGHFLTLRQQSAKTERELLEACFRLWDWCMVLERRQAGPTAEERERIDLLRRGILRLILGDQVDDAWLTEVLALDGVADAIVGEQLALNATGVEESGQKPQEAVQRLQPVHWAYWEEVCGVIGEAYGMTPEAVYAAYPGAVIQQRYTLIRRLAWDRWRDAAMLHIDVSTIKNPWLSTDTRKEVPHRRYELPKGIPGVDVPLHPSKDEWQANEVTVGGRKVRIVR